MKKYNTTEREYYASVIYERIINAVRNNKILYMVDCAKYNGRHTIIFDEITAFVDGTAFIDVPIFKNELNERIREIIDILCNADEDKIKSFIDYLNNTALPMFLKNKRAEEYKYR